ncbi:Type II secretion system protein G [Pandoraea aquatica]|uniref:Type II secretion system core protein G n=1 Tax=Pandoraea aquatica TaxID=2508290 RepID=A0A5E4TL57_9BURK|nr:type II secretion system major pseudopilin GspG [Pandoraea aquatica]VVD88271.1 Type II secretion system protein G [Pandoraea aquatica]
MSSSPRPLTSYRLHRTPDRRAHQAGFTLLELLVVLLIIALLAGYVGPKLFSQVDRAREKTAVAQMKSLSDALGQYRLDIGQYPTEEQGLQALMAAPAGVEHWQGPYLAKALPNDPWDHPYVWKNPGTSHDVEIVTYGPGGEGDTAKAIVYGF